MDHEEYIPLRALAMQFSHSGIVIADAQASDMPIIDCNPAFEVISGYRRAEVVGRNCRFLQHEDAEAESLTAIRKAVADRVHTTVIIKNYRKNGTMFWNELSISPVFGESGELTHFIGIQNDVTVRETVQRELRKENAQLSRMNRELVSKNQRQKNIDDRINEILRQSNM
jgi:PAS domain S-box-containing protein